MNHESINASTESYRPIASIFIRASLHIPLIESINSLRIIRESCFRTDSLNIDVLKDCTDNDYRNRTINQLQLMTKVREIVANFHGHLNEINQRRLNDQSLEALSLRIHYQFTQCN